MDLFICRHTVQRVINVSIPAELLKANPLFIAHDILHKYFVDLCHRVEERKETDSEKDAAMEAELRAARERAVVPQETRMGQFKDMLLERGVNESTELT